MSLIFMITEESDPCKSIERRSTGVVGSTQGQVMWLLDLAQPPLSHHQGKHDHVSLNFYPYGLFVPSFNMTISKILK